MSTQTSPAARRSVLSALLVRLLQVLGLTVRRFGPGVRITRTQANAHDVLATPQPAVPYQKKESARHPQ